MCECGGPGYCNRHKIYKNQILFEHCQRGEVCTVNGQLIEPPSYLQKIVNYGIAKTKHIIAGSPEVTNEVFNERISICQECPLFNSNNRECNKCGCPVDEKCKWATEECPDKPPRWNTVARGTSGCKSCGNK